MLMDAWQRENYEKNMMRTKICPYCNQSYYMMLYSDTSAAYYTPIYNINPNRKSETNNCVCMNCSKKFFL